MTKDHMRVRQHPTTKSEWYKWDAPGRPGVPVDLPISSLHVPIESYQRSKINNSRVLAIARALDWMRFGRLLVVKMPDGRYFVVDGQHRLLACMRRGDISVVPCEVFENVSIANQAKLFAKYRALIYANDPPALAVRDLCASLNLRIADTSDPGAIRFPRHLLDKISNRTACEHALVLARVIASDHQIQHTLFLGCFYLSNRGLYEEVARRGPAIARSGGQALFSKILKEKFAESGLRGLSDRLCGVTLLALVNYRCQRHIILDDVSD